MSDKTTLILTFVASVLVPFIRDLVDLIDSLRGKFTDNMEIIRDEIKSAVASSDKSAENRKDNKANNPYIRDVEPGYFSRFLSSKK